MTIQIPPSQIAPLPPLLAKPILPTLLGLSFANSLAMVSTALVSVAETAYAGRLGLDALAGIALVFPFAMLMQMMSAGAMGGGVSSAISRALGAGARDRAARLAWHAAVIGLAGGALFFIVMQVFGRTLYAMLGGAGGALDQATIFSHVLFVGAFGAWMTNTLASILRGTGDMRTPAIALIVVSVLQVVIGGGFGLGLFGLPQFGMAGIACGSSVAFTIGAIYLAWHLLSGRSTLPLNGAARFERGIFFDILRVGMISSIAPVQTVLIVLIFTRILSTFGPAALAGYGIGARLEFMLIPIAFAVGVASVPMIGMAIGAGLIARARRIAWTAAAVSGLISGSVGLAVAIWPESWISLFTTDAAITASASAYFVRAGLAYAFFGIGLTLYFCAQGAARVGGPVLAGTARLIVVAIGGVWLAMANAPASALFTLVGVAMAVYGIGTLIAVRITPWGGTEK